MKTSLDGLCELASHEAIVPMPYYDSQNVLTFGIGHTASAGSPDPATLPMGEEQHLSLVMETFVKDIRDCEARVNRAVKVPIEQHEFDALVSFDFNTGGIFRARLTKLLNEGDRAGAADAFMGWLKPKEIEGRRKAEQALFRDGTYTNDGHATVYKADARGKVLRGSARKAYIRDVLKASAGIRETDLTKSRTMKGATVAGVPGAAIAADGVAELVAATEKAGSFMDGGSMLKIAVGLVILAGALYAAYARATDAGWVPPWRKA